MGRIFVAMAGFSAVLAVGVAIWSEIDRVADSNVNAKWFSVIASELRMFVEATGRWPRSEEEFISLEGGVLDPSAREEAASRAIVVYDVDLKVEDLKSVESFRLLKPRTPNRLANYVFVEGMVEELLTTLRAARNGELPPPVSVGQAVPDDAEGASAGEAGGSRESVSEIDAAPK